MSRSSKRATPPTAGPAARCEGLGFDRVAAHAVLALKGCNGQSHFLADGARQEPAHGMRLPARDLHQFFSGDAAGPLQQVQDLGGLAAVADTTQLLSAFGRFLGWGGPLSRLTLLRPKVGALWAHVGLF